MGTTLTYTMLAVVLSASFSGAVHAWTPGAGNESDTSGFTVNRQSRIDVVSFWHAVYQESEGYEDRIDWAGLSGGPGTTSAVFKGDVQRRINYYRAMAGVSGDTSMSSTSTVLLNSETPSVARPSASTTKVSAAQNAAYMVTINSDEYRSGGSVATGVHNPHNPPTSWNWDTVTARNGAFYSNLAAGVYGPGAIDAYMAEGDQAAAGGTNHEVAHRRLLLYSRRAEFATGDVTMTPSGNHPYFAANALYSAGNLLAVPTPQFISWPSDGFFPEPLVSKYWSLSYPGADFSSATVSVTHGTTGSISTSVVSRFANYGDETLIWELNPSQLPSAADDDQTYQVVISHMVIDGLAQSYSYSVTVINPNWLNESLVLSGDLTPPDTGAEYHFDPVDQAQAYRFQVSTEVAGTWQEGAEDATSARVVDGTSNSYPFRASSAASSGSQGFHIGLTADNFRLQYVELARQFVASSNSALVFSSRKRRMGSGTRAKAEISIDDGASWVELWGVQGNGNYTNSFSQQVVSLSAYVGQIARVRFIVERPVDATSSYWPADDNSGDYNGIHIDEIEITGGDVELINIVETDYPADASQVLLDGFAAGGSVGDLLDSNASWRIRLQAKVGNQWFAFGPSLNVSPVNTGDGGDGDGGSEIEKVITHPEGSASPLVVVPTVVHSASAGKYGGFLTAVDGGRVSGYFKSIKVSTKGTFSAKMYLGGVLYSIKGMLDEAGHYTAVVVSKSGLSVALNLQLMRGPAGGYTIVGTVTSGGDVFDLLAVKSGPTSSLAGAYTLLVLGDEMSLAQGHGYATMTVTSTGAAKIKGLLGDGSKWTAKCYVTPDGEMPLYAALYRKQGSLGGLVRFRDVVGVSDCDGEVHWNKPGSFDFQCNLIGSRLRATGSHLIAGLPNTSPNVEAYVGAGSGYEEVAFDFEWTAANKILYVGPEKVKMTVKATKGELKGKIPSAGVNWQVGGVVFQKQGLVGGMMYIKGGAPRSFLMQPKD